MLTEQPPHKIASLGIARTFQNIELFEHATVLHNMLIGRHTHRSTGLWSELFFTGKARHAEIEAREKVEQVIDFLDLQHHRDSHGRRPALRRAQGGRAGARAVHRAQAAAAGRAFVRA